VKEVAIVSYARTPIGKFGGVFKRLSAVELGSVAIKAALERANVHGNEIDQVIMGVVWQAGLRANPARQAAMKAAITVEAPAVTINQQCSSGIRALEIAADQIRLGKANVIVSGGFESMSGVPYLDLSGRWGHKRGTVVLDDGLYYDGLNDAFTGENMGITAETVGRNAKLTREEVDLFALSSQQKAALAMERGRFKQEIAPVIIRTNKEDLVVDTDECPRKETTLKTLAQLPPVFISDGISTAGNSPPLSDGGAALVLMDKDYAKQTGSSILGYFVDAVSVGVAPEVMGYGPVPAVTKLLNRHGLTVEDIAFLEINEAFGAQALACIRELGFPLEKVNVNGGAIALGHPPGCTGARLVGTLLYQLQRTNQRYGIATLCAGGGPAIAALVRGGE
jgi:acetyl-CoA C-acetyltransferase